MFELRKEFRFEASHQLVDHDGKCARLHGHSWVFRLFVRGHHLQASGPQRNMVRDFYEIGSVGKEIAEKLDHQHLNDLFPEAAGHVTSEWLAYWIYHFAAQRIAGLVAVDVEETCTSGCEYRP